MAGGSDKSWVWQPRQREGLEPRHGGVGSFCWRGVAGNEAFDRIMIGKSTWSRSLV